MYNLGLHHDSHASHAALFCGSRFASLSRPVACFSLLAPVTMYARIGKSFILEPWPTCSSLRELSNERVLRTRLFLLLSVNRSSLQVSPTFLLSSTASVALYSLRQRRRRGEGVQSVTLEGSPRAAGCSTCLQAPRAPVAPLRPTHNEARDAARAVDPLTRLVLTLRLHRSQKPARWTRARLYATRIRY